MVALVGIINVVYSVCQVCTETVWSLCLSHCTVCILLRYLVCEIFNWDTWPTLVKTRDVSIIKCTCMSHNLCLRFIISFTYHTLLNLGTA